jgi:hypothetical protein
MDDDLREHCCFAHTAGSPRRPPHVLIRDQADRDAISSRLMRYRDQNGQTRPTSSTS